MCWDYALSWMKQTNRLAAAGVAGPLFISVGRSDQLAKFLDLNPELAGAPALIDDTPTFEAYRAAGFNYLMGDKPLEGPPEMKVPTANRCAGTRPTSYRSLYGEQIQRRAPQSSHPRLLPTNGPLSDCTAPRHPKS